MPAAVCDYKNLSVPSRRMTFTDNERMSLEKRFIVDPWIGA